MPSRSALQYDRNMVGLVGSRQCHCLLTMLRGRPDISSENAREEFVFFEILVVCFLGDVGRVLSLKCWLCAFLEMVAMCFLGDVGCVLSSRCWLCACSTCKDIRYSW